MADIFISYSKSRRKETVDLAAELERRGFTVWWDKDITPGETFRDSIAAELANARAVIVVWTPASVKSNWVISEATRAQKRGILIAVHSTDLNIDDLPVPFDVVHSEPIENHSAIFAALARIGVSPSAAAGLPDSTRGLETNDSPPAARLVSSRRMLLIGGAVALSGGAIGLGTIFKLQDRLRPDAGMRGPVHTLNSPDMLYVSTVAFTLDGRYVLSGSWDQRLRLWDPLSQQEIRRFEGHEGPVWSALMLPDGQHVLSASGDSTLRLWNLSSNRSIREFRDHEDEIWALAALPDGRRALSGSKDTTLKLWDIASAKVVSTFSAGDQVRSVAAAARGQLALCAAKNVLQLWDVAEGNKVRSFDGHEGRVNSVAIAANGLHALSGGDDGTLRLWDLASGQQVRKFADEGSDRVMAIAISPSGRTALSGSVEGVARLWDLRTGQLLKTFKGHNDSVDAVAIAGDGRVAVTGSRDKTLQIWDLSGMGSGIG